MNEVNKTLFIPLYGKAKVSKKGMILQDPMAEQIWDKEAFQITGKAKSKWLTYNRCFQKHCIEKSIDYTNWKIEAGIVGE